MKTALTILIASALAAHANSHGVITGEITSATGTAFTGMTAGDDLTGTWTYDPNDDPFSDPWLWGSKFSFSVVSGAPLLSSPFRPLVNEQEVPIGFEVWTNRDMFYGTGGFILHHGNTSSYMHGTMFFLLDQDVQQSSRQAAIPEGGATAGLLALALAGMFVARKL